MGSMLLVAVDAHPKWMDGHRVQPVSTAITMEKLHASFSTHVILKVLVSQNGTLFFNQEFIKLINLNEI